MPGCQVQNTEAMTGVIFHLTFAISARAVGINISHASLIEILRLSPLAGWLLIKVRQIFGLDLAKLQG